MKINFHHFAWKPVTWAKFHQVLPTVWPFWQHCGLNLRWQYAVGTKIGVSALRKLEFQQKIPYQDPCDKLPFCQVAL